MRLMLALLLAASPAVALARNPSSQVDYDGFRALTAQVSDYRRSRLLGWDDFAARARQKDVLLLDARSAEAYAAGHIGGAVNLPFTDFTAASLAQVIGDRNRPILIYCNNNFVNDRAPVRMKARPLALNIQTFINLVGYGYRNVYELRDAIDLEDSKVGWVKGEAALRREAARERLLGRPSGG